MWRFVVLAVLCSIAPTSPISNECDSVVRSESVVDVIGLYLAQNPEIRLLDDTDRGDARELKHTNFYRAMWWIIFYCACAYSQSADANRLPEDRQIDLDVSRDVQTHPTENDVPERLSYTMCFCACFCKPK